MRNAYRHAIAALILCYPLAVGAQPVPPCPAPVPLTGALAPWNTPANRAAATDPTQLGHAPLVVGQALRVPLLAQNAVSFAAPPGKPGAPDSHAGLLALAILDAGTYRIALGSPGWIDLVQDGAPVTSSAHEHGPACSGIHKIVDFALQPGRYIVQISADTEPRTTVLVTRAP